MIYLLLAILSSATIAILMRVSSDRISANLSMLATNYFICSFLSALYAGFDLLPLGTEGLALTVALGILSGILFLGGFVMLQITVRKNGVVLSSVFMKLGLLVPILLSVLFFHEVPTALQVAGFCIALCAIVLINLGPSSGEKHMGLGLIVLLLLGGGADATAKVFHVFCPAALSDPFLFYTFAVALLLCIGLVIAKGERSSWREILFGTLIGIPNFFSTKFLLGALTKLPAVVVYPTFSVGTLLIVTLAGVALFRERLRRHQWIALGAIIPALVLLNI